MLIRRNHNIVGSVTPVLPAMRSGPVLAAGNHIVDRRPPWCKQQDSRWL